ATCHSERREESLLRPARFFAALRMTARTSFRLAIADGAIAFYEAKYHYQIWRPITAIRLADTDGNPETVANPNWNSLATTPPDPSYPGAHSVGSAIASIVLAAFYGDQHHFQVTSDVLPGVVRSFDSYSDAQTEAGLSRIYGRHPYAARSRLRPRAWTQPCTLRASPL
ncbi:MAG: vanadium-dependent haloperoxidase, partial [Ktedonobacteraceae bacterium]